MPLKLSTFQDGDQIRELFSKQILQGNTALLKAIRHNQVAVVEKLLAARAQVDASLSGQTALYFAASKGHSGVVEKLLAAGANKDAADTLLGSTVMHAAVEGYHRAIFEMLLAVSATIYADIEGRTPMQRAVKLGYVDILKVFQLAQERVWGKNIRNLSKDSFCYTSESRSLLKKG